MGKLLKSFTIDRNILKSNLRKSANAVREHISHAQSSRQLDKRSSNIVGALASYTGVLARDDDGGHRITDLGRLYLELHTEDPEDAWRWLVTRSLWRYVVPNGTHAAVNDDARQLGAQFAFFHKIVACLKLLEAEPAPQRFLFFEELFELLDDDSSWQSEPRTLAERIVARRSGLPKKKLRDRTGLLDLEAQYSVPRDNFAGLFRKGFAQTEFFEFLPNRGSPVAIAIRPHLPSPLSDRLRFILDHPPEPWDPSQDWGEFLELQDSDLPRELGIPEFRAATDDDEDMWGEPVTEADLRGLVTQLHSDLQEAGYLFSEELLRRFVASLLAKPLVILTGLSGSGKTLLAQAFADWIAPSTDALDPFVPGAVFPSERVSYVVSSADSQSVEFLNSDEVDEATRVSLPKRLIRTWAETIADSGYDKDTPARTIRETVGPRSQYSGQLNAFETHLKTAALALLEARKEVRDYRDGGYELVAVGADWTSNEEVVGYPDALDPSKYVKTETLKLLLRANRDRERPYFLILDEMNLSHVERYFSDFLSSLESGEPISLHSDQDSRGRHVNRDGVPPEVVVPSNLYVIGTVNVDETTYMFSPKVLDRANVLEFRSDLPQLLSLLEKPKSHKVLSGRGRGYARAFQRARVAGFAEAGYEHARLRAELELFFKVLSRGQREFGFRVVNEIQHFLVAYLTLGGSSFRTAFDSQICQKILPKLHGSRRQVEGILRSLSVLCGHSRSWVDTDSGLELENASEIEAEAVAQLEVVSSDRDTSSEIAAPEYPTSFDKVERMLSRLERDGFVSFAEA